MKVFITPEYNTADKGDGGIRRVIEALNRHLPEHGIELAINAESADVINCHGTSIIEVAGTPIVGSCHGLYWNDYEWGGWAHEANYRVKEVLIRSAEITSPSNWVSKTITRALLRRPHTIYHGVEADEWAHSLDHEGYVLWNKARFDPVSDPMPVLELARRMPDIQFVVCAFPEDYEKPHNLRVLGTLPYNQMREIIQRAGLYLATTRETFGIGTLEAMASGVPVVGFNYGGQTEIIIEGYNGYLRPYNDYNGMVNAIRTAFTNREELSINARFDVDNRWLWNDKIKQYAQIFNLTARKTTKQYIYGTSFPAHELPRNRRKSRKPNADGIEAKISVLMTCYKLGEFVKDAVNSLKAQTLGDFECIIVDDNSPDNGFSQAAIAAAVGNDTRFHTVFLNENVGLAQARNIAFSYAKGRYIIALDADDTFTPDTLELLSSSLDRSADTYIAYGHLGIMGRAERNNWPFETFSYRKQIAHYNQMPYAAMMRREVLERTGGYRIRDWRAEDASLWCRATSHGMYAKKVTQRNTLVYRIRPNSKSGIERTAHDELTLIGPPDGNWNWFTPYNIFSKATPWAAQDRPDVSNRSFKGRDFWKVPHLAHQRITVIIPVCDTHVKHLPDALDSVLAQTSHLWDCIVVDDTTTQDINIDAIGAPWAILKRTGEGKKGPGFARNLGAHHATTEFVLFLDADDFLMPEALEIMLEVKDELPNTTFVYPDGYQERDNKVVRCNAPDYTQRFWEMKGQIPVTVLINRNEFLAMGGFNEAMAGWEDRELFIRLGVNGYCGARIALPLFVYRVNIGERRRNADTMKDELLSYLKDKYAKYYTDLEQTMCGCKGNSNTVKPNRRVGEAVQETTVLGGVTETQNTVLEFQGKQTGLLPFKGYEGRMYFGANSATGRRIEVHPDDIDKLLSTGRWKVAPAVVMVSQDSVEVLSPEPPLTKKPGE